MADGIDIPTAAEALAAESTAALQAAQPSWEAKPASFMLNVLQANALQLARVMQVFTESVDARVFRGLGERVGEPLLEASSASVTLVFTTVSAAVVIPAGYQVKLVSDDGIAIGFETVETLTTVANTGSVLARCLVPGAIGSGISGDAVPLTSSTEVIAVETDGESIGGRDLETAEEYDPRLQAGLSLLWKVPAVKGDMERWLAVRGYGLGRALVIDNYVPAGFPGGPATGVALATTIAVTGPDGLGAGSVKTTISDDLGEVRGQDYEHYVIDATYTTVDVYAAVIKVPGADPVQVDAATVAAYVSFLDPFNFARPTSGDNPAGALVGWQSGKDTLRLLEMGGVAEDAIGVSQATEVLFGKRRAVTGAAATDIFTSNGHGFVVDTPVVFSSVTGGGPIAAATRYYARDITTNTFKVAATPGGAAVNVTADMTAGSVSGLGTANVVLTGPAPLTIAGTILVDVT